MNPDRDDAIAIAYAEGESLRQIALAHDVSHECVRQVLVKRGAKLRSRGEGVKARRASRARAV